jgi:hypothetical protein
MLSFASNLSVAVACDNIAAAAGESPAAYHEYYDHDIVHT